MSATLNFLQSEHVLALLIAILIFLTTIFLVIKRWIGFSITLLLLLFALAAGLLINSQQELEHYFSLSTSHSIEEEKSSSDFHKQILQAVEDLKSEVATEKENLQRVMQQVQDIFHSMDIQKQKFQHFIEEVREHFKSDYPLNSSSHDVDAHSSETLKE
jgi:uncharacterized protein (DUF58 family)